jgi:predicted transcriptional regulator
MSRQRKACRFQSCRLASGITGYTRRMKTAISLPDDLSKAIDGCARELRLTRSGLLAQAAREFLARRRHSQNPTEAWNIVVDKAGQPGDDPAAIAFRRRTKSVIRAAGKRR